MLPGPDDVLKCNHCGALTIRTTWASGNTFGAVQWSDGYLAAAMLPASIEVALCPACRKLLWLEDCELIGEIPPPWYSSILVKDESDDTAEPETPAAWQEAPHLEALGLEDFAAALIDSADADAERKFYLHLLVWHRLNDLRRDGESSLIPAEHADQFKQVCEALLISIEKSADQNSMLAVEILRELERFDEALDVLGRVSGEDSIVAALSSRCRLKDSSLFELSFDENRRGEEDVRR